MPNQAYRLRIRNAAGTADTLVLTSIRGGTNPYIAAVPSGDGQEVDLLTGAVRTGAYVIEVVDAVMGTDSNGTLRIVTQNLYDGTEEYLLLENGDKILLENGDPIELERNNAEFGRPHLLSRAAFLEMSTDGGSNWTVWQAGYLTSVRQIDAIRYAFTISNTRRIEQNKQLFTWSDSAERTAFPKRGCVVGGPVINGFGVGANLTTDSGGWEFAYLNTSGSASAPVQGDIIALEYRAGYFWPDWSRKAIPGPGQATDFWNMVLPYRDLLPGDRSLVGSDFNGLNDHEIVPSYPRLTAVFTYTVGSTSYTMYGTVRAFFTDYNRTLVQQAAIALGEETNRWIFGYLNSGRRGRLFIELEAINPSNPSQPWSALPSRLSIGRVRLVASQVDESSPLYLDEHPVDIAEKCYNLIGIIVDSTTRNAVREVIGTTTRLAMRVTKPVTMAEFLESTLFGPFGFAARVNTKIVDGELKPVVEFFVTRYLDANPPSYTIANADIIGDQPPPIFDLDESTVVTSFVVEQQTLFKLGTVQDDTSTPPPDGIVATTQAYQLDNGDTSTYSTRVVEYKIPGMVHEVANWTSTLNAFAQGIAWEGFNRFGRGAPSMEVQVLRTASAAAAQIGDLVYLDASYFPNKNYRIGESNVGPRVAQIVRRDERPEGPIFKLVDAGVYNQPALAPTISIAKSTADPRRLAQFTVTNASALNNSAELTVAIEYATGSSEPTANGITLIRYQPLAIPTVPVLLPPVTPGSTVYVRARSEQAGLFPSLWTNWQAVTLDSWSVPSSITVTDITNGSALVSWNIGSNTTDAIDVFVAPGSTAPSNWQPYRINSLPPGSTSTTVTILDASTNYIVGVAFRDAVGDTRGTIATQTFSTTASTSGTALRPAGMAVVDGVADASLAQGVILALWQAAGTDVIVIERAPNVAGVPGAYTEIAVVPAPTTLYVDYLPRTGTMFWYRIKHVRSGQTDSSYIEGISGISTGIPASITRPDAVSPVIAITTDESGATATVTLTITDSQHRITQVRFRERTNGGSWSAWTVDTSIPYAYSATIPAVGFVDIQYEVSGYNAAGVFGVLASGVESFDADTNATIVTATGTFSLAGALTLSVQGDSDTNSFKYAVATTNWANDAAAYTAAQAGTLVNARNGTITLAGPYSVGTTVYVAIAGYTGASASGTVSGPYRYAFINGAQDTVYALCEAIQTAADATSITVQVNGSATIGTPQVRLVSIAGTATRTAGATAGTLVASGSSWTFSRGAFASGTSQVEFEAVLAGAVTDADFIEIPEQGRDTVPLLTRARVTATSATSVTVRVAVADPYPQGTDSVSLAYVTLGLGTVTPSSPQLITPQSTLTEAAGTYVDFTVPRPSAGAGMGRITFTASASGRVSDADAVDVTPSILVYSLCEATQTNANETTVEVTVTATADNGTPEVRYTGLDGTATKFSGPNLNVLSPSGTTWVFTRGAFDSGPSQASFESVLAGAVTDVDFITIPEQQRDTVPLIARARVTAVDANNITVRVAVADPYPQGTNSATIALSSTGLGTITQTNGSALPSPIQVTPESTLTEASGTYYDFLVPRPTANSAPGRVTFTATAANRTSDSDATDVVPKNPVPASLTVNYTASDTEYVITWSVGTTDTATLSIDGGSFSTPPSSPITVARAPYKTGTDKVYTFKSTGAANDVLTSSVTVAKQLPFVSNPPDVTVTGVVKDSATAATVSWTFTDIPAGSTWTVSGKAFDVGSGTVTNTGIALGTSPKSRQLTGFTGMGTGTLFRATVTAYDSGSNIVASDTLDVTF